MSGKPCHSYWMQRWDAIYGRIIAVSDEPLYSCFGFLEAEYWDFFLFNPIWIIFLIVYEIQTRRENTVLLSLQGIQSSFKGSELSRVLWEKKAWFIFFPKRKQLLYLRLCCSLGNLLYQTSLTSFHILISQVLFSLLVSLMLCYLVKKSVLNCTHVYRIVKQTLVP